MQNVKYTKIVRNCKKLHIIGNVLGFFLLVEEEGVMVQKKLLLCLESGHCLQWLILNAYANKMLL